MDNYCLMRSVWVWTSEMNWSHFDIRILQCSAFVYMYLNLASKKFALLLRFRCSLPEGISTQVPYPF